MHIYAHTYREKPKKQISAFEYLVSATFQGAWKLNKQLEKPPSKIMTF